VGGKSRIVWLFLVPVALLAIAVLGQNPQQPAAPPASDFTDRTAANLLGQLAESLQGHSQKKFLVLFDLSQVKDSGRFKQQIALFFSHTESIRVHLNLMETAFENGRGTAAVDAEMELQPINNGKAVRQSGRLTFAAAKSGNGWKFVDIEPRSFFSLP